MLGFFADYAGGEIACQPEEIEEAAWYHVERLPLVPPATVSVAGELIKRYVNLVRQGKH
jgi:NAD+ diphosphatase